MFDVNEFINLLQTLGDINITEVVTGCEHEAQTGRRLKVVQGINVRDKVGRDAFFGVGRKFDGKVTQREEHAKHILLIIGQGLGGNRAVPLVVIETGPGAIEQVEAIDGHYKQTETRN